VVTPSRFAICIMLLIFVGIGQLIFAMRVLNHGGSTYWFLTIIVAGMFTNLAIIVTAISGISRAQVPRAAGKVFAGPDYGA